jgi:hypothetical protein
MRLKSLLSVAVLCGIWVFTSWPVLAKLPAHRFAFLTDTRYNGSSQPMCHAMLKLLNAPENRFLHDVGENMSTAAFVVPERFKDFQLPVWTPITAAEASAESQRLAAKIAARDPQFINALYAHTRFDINSDGIPDEVIRRSFSQEDSDVMKKNPSGEPYYSSYFLSEIKNPKWLVKEWEENFYEKDYQAGIFLYSGKSFFLQPDWNGTHIVMELQFRDPVSFPENDSYIPNFPICFLKQLNPDWQ